MPWPAVAAAVSRVASSRVGQMAIQAGVSRLTSGASGEAASSGTSGGGMTSMLNPAQFVRKVADAKPPTDIIQ